MFFAALVMVSTATGEIIYVDDDATSPGDGTSWETAFTYLQDALMVASSGHEIRVAQGIYRPDDFVLSARPNMGREETFQLKNGVTIKGGYAGFNEPDPNDRDIDAYETILSGDLNGDDGPDFTDNGENSIHVVNGSGTDATAVLDGFTITAGNANGSYPDYCGGGMYNDSGSPTLINCIFRDNKAGYYEYIGPEPLSDNSSSIIGNDITVRIPPPQYVWRGRGAGMYCVDSNVTLTNCKFSGNLTKERGAGMYNSGSSPTLINCTFSENSAVSGGGMGNWQGSSPTLTRCTFRENSAIGGGGGMRNEDNSNPTLTNCTFQRNSAMWSGGMYNFYSSPTLTNCTFSRNSGDGGGMYNYKSNPILANCIFSGNSANKSGGGGMVSNNSSPTLTSCTFSGNSAKYGGGIYNYSGSPTFTNCMISGNLAVYGAGMYNRGRYDVCNPKLTNCTFAANSALSGNALACDSMEQRYPSNVQVTNCVLWDGGDEIWNNDGSTITITYSDVQGGWLSEGNIDDDPLFVELGYWDANGTPYDANDDFWIAGDYHLKSEAGRWDANSESWVQDANTSPCIDAGNSMNPIGNEPFPNGGRVNMGAYGATSEASKSYFGTTPCEIIVAGDVNGDCEVNFLDFRLMALHWCEDNNP